VLIAFGEHPHHGPDVLLVERASTLRDHAGQVAFPGGGREPGDADAVATALREAEEETGLAPEGVVPLALLPRLHLPPSGFLVTPVVAHWAEPVAVRAVDPAETAAVVRVPLSDLTDPANRVRVRHYSGMTGNAFLVAGLLVWGFTGGLLSALLDLGGWVRPWDESRVMDLEDAWSAARSGQQEGTER
jgi:8-oxo-dGTP pyrophosphatase MutT (NUDIX family)